MEQVLVSLSQHNVWIISLIVLLLNNLGAIMLLLSTVDALYKWLFKKNRSLTGLNLQKNFAISIQVLLAAEILRLITIRDIEDLFLIGTVLLLHVVVTILVRFEIGHHFKLIKQKSADES